MEPKRPTFDEVIQWYQEMAWYTGAIGFTEASDAQELLKDWKVESAPDVFHAAPGSALDLMDATAKLHTDDLRAKANSDRLRMIETDKLFRADVKYEINRRLLKAGKSQQEIHQHISMTSSLSAMATYLYKVEHSPPSLEHRYKAYVYTNFRGTKQPTPIFLSAKDTFPEMLAALREFVLCKAEATGVPVTAGDDLTFMKSWKCKLGFSHGGVLKRIDSAWDSLASEPDYRSMLVQVKRRKKDGAFPAFMPVDPVPPTPVSSPNHEVRYPFLKRDQLILRLSRWIHRKGFPTARRR